MASKSADVRPKITLACVDCKERNYITKKNRRNDPDRLELEKFCPRCGKHTVAPRDPLTSHRPRGPTEPSPAGGGSRRPAAGWRHGVNPDFAGRVYPPDGRLRGRPREDPRVRRRPPAPCRRTPRTSIPRRRGRSGYPDVVAPPTFAVIVGPAQRGPYWSSDPEAGIDFSRVVHGEQRFMHHRPIVAGDRLMATLHVDARPRGRRATRWSPPAAEIGHRGRRGRLHRHLHARRAG